METIITYILSIVDKLDIFIKNVNTKQWIIIYSIIAIICAMYLAWFRIKKIRDYELYIKSDKNTKRAKAIERFQNFNNQLVTELNQQCETELNIEDTKTIPTRDKLFINKDFEPSFMIQLSPNTQKNYNNGKQILENFLFIIDSKITDFVDKTKLDYDSIINITIHNNQYVQENILDTKLDSLDKQIHELEMSLDTELKTVIPEDQTSILRTLNFEEKAYKTKNFEIEVKERLFEYVSADKRKIFREICKLRASMKQLQIQIDSLNPNLSQEAYLKANKEQDSIRLNLSDLEAKYKMYILILSRLATTSQAQKILKQESGAMSTLLIQPSNETQIDAMAQLKQKMALYADPGLVGNPVTDKAVELDLTKKYAGAYQDYIDNMNTYTLNAKIDPIKIVSDLEEKTLDFLTKLNGNLSGDSAETNKSAFSPINRFGTQKNNLGTWLVPQNPVSQSNLNRGDPIPATDISKLASVLDKDKTEKSYVEGFQNIESDTQKNNMITNTNDIAITDAYGYLSTVESFIKYIYGYITGFMDEKSATKLESLLTSEDNMIPIGVILIFVSIILFLASASDSTPSV